MTTTLPGKTEIDPPDGLVMTTLDIDAHAQALADMWNASDANWPGTWTGGVPETAEKVRRDYERSEAIETFVCLDGEVLAGFCKVCPDHDEPSVDYVALVNVPPSHQKRGLARRLLQRANALSVERGSYRLDLHTWSANLNAVPLYKKCGFMWMPDTDIHMLNFMPAILRLDAAKEFFADRDWYEVFRRPLDQVPDEDRWEGMKVFTYRFADSPGDPADAEPALVVRVDREARAICALETADYAVSSTSARLDPPRGGEVTLRWTVTNRGEGTLPVTVVANGNDQLLIDYRGSAEVAPGQTAVLESRCRVSADAPDVKRHKPVPAVKSVLLLGGEVVELSTGLRPRPALEIGTWPARITVMPGGRRTVDLRLRNRLEHSAEVDVRVTPGPGVETDWTERRLSVDAEGWIGTQLEVRASSGESGAHPLSISASAEVDGATLRVEPEPRHVFAVAPGAVVATPEKECLRIENSGLRAILNQEGAGFSLFDPLTGAMLGSSTAVVGPPMWPSEFWSLDSELSLERRDGKVVAVAAARSKRWPGIVFRRRITFNASPVIELAAEVENGGDEPRRLQLMQWAGAQFGSQVVVPLKSGIRRAAGWDHFPGPDDDELKRPEAWAERWMATDDTRDGRVSGAVWGGDAEEITMGGLLSNSTEVGPQSRHAFDPTWFYCGPGTWRVVRDLWRRREGIAVSPAERRPDVAGMVRAEVEPAPWLVSSTGRPVTLVVDHACTWALTGAARIVAPEGWRADIDQVELAGTKWNRPARHEIELVPPPNSKAKAAMVRVEVRDSEYDEDLEVPVLHLPEGTVGIEKTTFSEMDVWRVTNGACEIEVAPSFAGATVGFSVDGVQQLATPFPEPGAIAWLLPWHGGISPFLLMGETSFPGQLWKESFTAEEVEEKDGRGLIWAGVRVSAESSHEDSRGLRVEATTLAVASAPIVKHVLRVRNNTGSHRSPFAGSLIFAAPGGDRHHTHLHSDDFSIKPSEKYAWNATGTWAAAVNSTSGATLLACSDLDVGTLRFGTDGGHLSSYRMLEIPAGDAREIVTYLVAAESLEAAKPWRALVNLG